MTSPDLMEPLLGLADRGDRLRLRIKGPDRVRFLQNLTTNDVASARPGPDLETFITNPQGKTLGYAHLFIGEEDILLRSDAGAIEPLTPHFEKYGVFDEVSWNDESAETFELHLFGQRLPEALGRLGLVPPAIEERSGWIATIEGLRILAIVERPTGRAGVTLIGTLAERARLEASLDRAVADLGLARVDPSVFEALRIEAGTPVFGRDVTPANLPQELDRDDRAISFKKGCYLGQETVARIDALGHVNKLLRGLAFRPGAAVPPPGTALLADGKQVGTVTSSAFSARLGRPVGLGYVRRTHAAPGQVLDVGDPAETAAATVVPLPMPDTLAAE